MGNPPSISILDYRNFATNFTYPVEGFFITANERPHALWTGYTQMDSYFLSAGEATGDQVNGCPLSIKPFWHTFDTEARWTENSSERSHLDGLHPVSDDPWNLLSI